MGPDDFLLDPNREAAYSILIDSIIQGQ